MGLPSFQYDKEWIEMATIAPEAKKTYLERRKSDSEKCRAALKSQDWETIARVGHKIKGNAETFGFNALTAIGVELEKQAGLKDAAQTSKAIAQFESALESLSADSEY